MNFIKKMKKREFIEMSLKTIAAILGCFIAIILMEGMIYSIQLGALLKKADAKNNNYITYEDSSIAYCIEKEKDVYYVIYSHEETNENGTKTLSWCTNSNKFTKDELTAKNLRAKEVVMHAPNAFQLSINGIHFVVMAVFVLAVGGFYTYRFVKLGKEYKRIETEFKKSGTIEISNK